METTPDAPPKTGLIRRFNLLQATALNMSNMVGVGPFITIPLLLTALGGPQSMLGWFIAFVITFCDGMVWSELGAMMPGSGGTYHYLRNGFASLGVGRLMAFLFIWQFIFSGPMEIASGYIGFSSYLHYLWPNLSVLQDPRTAAWVLIGVAVAVGILNIFLLYRRITSIAAITVSLWIGTLLTIAIVVLSGIFHFDPSLAFDFPQSGALSFSWGFLVGLGQATRIGVYDYLGYYDICYIGEEVKNPGKVIPRSILISLSVVALLYFLINLSVIGVVPWREFVPAADHEISKYIVSVFMERLYGSTAASIFTLLILWTAMASVFALLLGYSRIPYAAARDGNFFAVFGKLHTKGNFPHVSLLVIGGISILCCAFSLDTVIEALVTTRIVIQFIGQIAAVVILRRQAPKMERPYRIWLYPLPCLLALIGWIFVFLTSGKKTILFALLVIAAGLLFYAVWSRLKPSSPVPKPMPEPR